MRKVESKYSPGKEIREDQYIVEIICENRAKKDKLALPTKFWELPEWRAFFVMQLRITKKLLDQHGFTKLISFIVNKNIYMLHAKWIPGALEEYTIPQQHQEITFENLNEKSLGRINKQNDFSYLD